MFLRISFLESRVTGGYQNENSLEQLLSKVQIPYESVCSEAGFMCHCKDCILVAQMGHYSPTESPREGSSAAPLFLGSPHPSTLDYPHLVWAGGITGQRRAMEETISSSGSSWNGHAALGSLRPLFLWQVKLVAHDKYPCPRMNIRLLEGTEQHLITYWRAL